MQVGVLYPADSIGARMSGSRRRPYTRAAMDPTPITRPGAAGGLESWLAGELGLEALAGSALRELADAARAEVGALWAAPEEGGPAVLLAVRGLAREALPPEARAGEGLSGRALAEGRVVHAGHGETGLEVRGLGGVVRVRRELHVPLRLSGAPLGVVALGRLDEAAPGRAEIEELQRLADAAAVALAHLQLHERAQRQARLDRALLDATPDPIALLGPGGEILVENGPMAALRAAGLDELDAPGDDPDREVRDELRLEVGPRALARYAAPVRDASGAPLGRIVVLHDVSAERESDRLKDEFSSLVSHELRTPLTSIIGYVELVLDGGEELSPDARRFLEVVERNAKRLLRMVADVLFVAQVEAGRISLARAPVDLGEVAAEAVETARPAAERVGVELVFEAEPLRPLVGDRDRFAQMLDNLVSNAVKFSGRGGHVEVRLADRGDRAVLEVADDGVGIPADEQERLFERFFRASTATANAVPGAGLGLTIVKAIVELHEGEVEVSSAGGAGTTMRVSLPYEALPVGRR
jgi:signal transduction histidine kinase